MARSRCGIYRITNTYTGEFYIGQSFDVAGRFRDHISMLQKGKHHAKRLQASFDLHGLTAFAFQVLELCSRKDLLLRERHWMMKERPSLNSMLPDNPSAAAEPEDTVDFLREILADGPVPITIVRDAGLQRQLLWNETIERSRKQLKVGAIKKDNDWCWALPKDLPPPGEPVPIPPERLCEMCKEKERDPGNRYCPWCAQKVLAKMRRHRRSGIALSSSN